MIKFGYKRNTKKSRSYYWLCKCDCGNEKVIKGSNFKNTRFEGKTWMKHCDLRNCNFTGAFLPYVEYQYSDLRGISLCETVFRLGVKCGYKSRFDPDIFTNLCKYLDMDTSKEK